MGGGGGSIFFFFFIFFCFFFQAEDGIRDLVRSRGLGDVYKRQVLSTPSHSNVRSVFLKSMSSFFTETIVFYLLDIFD